MKKGMPGDDVLRALYPNASINEILEKLRESTGRVWTRKDAYNRAHNLGILRQVREPMLPPSLGVLRRPITIEDSRLLLCSDSHIPFHDRDVWGNICKVGKERGITTLVHVGDFVDQQCFAKFDPLAPPVKWADEERVASDLIFEISHVFKRIILLCGNHEQRIVKRLAGQLPFSDVMRGWEVFDIIGQNNQVDIENLPVAWLGDWGMVCHPSSYSQTSGSVAVKLCEKYERDVYMGHDHYIALRFDRSGRHKAISLGCCTRENITDYKTFTVTCHPVWNPGFWTVVDRVPMFHLK